jgi:hypothetical protein
MLSSHDVCPQPQNRSLKNKFSPSPFTEKITNFESGTARAALEAIAQRPTARIGVIQKKRARGQKKLKTNSKNGSF